MARESQSAGKDRSAHGVLAVEFDTWQEYVNYLLTRLLEQPEFIWCVQRFHHWTLAPGLDRLLYRRGYSPATSAWSTILFEHLERFKLASRGRGDLDPRALEERVVLLGDEEADEVLRMSPTEREENNWWAVGQHYGLQTPLLDWSTSPFVAAFFAYEQEHGDAEQGERRAVYGLHKRLMALRCDELRENSKPDTKPPVVDFIEPLYKDNPRLVSQGGLFTRAPNGVAVKDWVQTHFNGQSNEVWMLEITLPDEEPHPPSGALCKSASRNSASSFVPHLRHASRPPHCRPSRLTVATPAIPRSL